MTPSLLFDDGNELVRDASCLPRLPDRINTLYADMETSSGDPKKMSTNPWYDCATIGAAVTWDDCPTVFFIPRKLLATGWWQDVVSRSKTWANHNVKYDAHVSANDLGAVPQCEFRCTLTGAKLIDSDKGFHGGFGLDALSRDWLKRDIAEYEFAMQPYLRNNKDYGAIPLDLLAEYACIDVEQGRALDRYEAQRMPEESHDVWTTEQRFTRLLFKMERTGTYVNPTLVKVKQYETLSTMLQLEEELHKLVGRSFTASSNDDCYDVLCGQFGLPVLAWTEPNEDTGYEGGPSFDKHALAKYLTYPGAPAKIVQRIVEYRKAQIFNSLFLNKYGELAVDGVMHPSYNQMVRTGRMSCSDPNMQQLSGAAKELIIPPPGHVIVSADYSQIEFRIIVHYINNARCIAAYRQDPWTDFHQWVADMVPTARKPAKTINFMMGYGGGKKKTVQQLSTNTDVVGEAIKLVDSLNVPDSERPQAIMAACSQRAMQVYNKYHELLPELKPTSKGAESAARRRGYVRNHYGRRRTLSLKAAHIAFNSACQSTAGDMIKERMVALDEQVPEFLQANQVHDQVLGYLPIEAVENGDLTMLQRICDVMNAPARPLNVPVRTAIGFSDKNWKHAQSEEREMKL